MEINGVVGFFFLPTLHKTPYIILFFLMNTDLKEPKVTKIFTKLQLRLL